MKNKIYLIEGHDRDEYPLYSAYVNKSVCEGSDSYSYVILLDNESRQIHRQYDDLREMAINDSAELSYDVLYTSYARMDIVSDFKRNDEPLEEVRVYADDIIENLVPIFEDDEAFKKMCKSYNLDGALELLS